MPFHHTIISRSSLVLPALLFLHCGDIGFLALHATAILLQELQGILSHQEGEHYNDDGAGTDREPFGRSSPPVFHIPASLTAFVFHAFNLGRKLRKQDKTQDLSAVCGMEGVYCFTPKRSLLKISHITMPTLTEMFNECLVPY